MAATTIITSSNGWKTRPLVESDYDFFMEAFSDYPLGTKSYRIRQNKFSGCIYNNSLYNDSIIKSGAVTQGDGVQSQGVIRTYVTERPDGKAVSIRLYIFHEAHLMVIRSMVVHPTYRGNGYAKDAHGIGVGLCREFNITKVRAWLEATPTFPAITPMRTRYNAAGISLDMSTDTNTADVEGGESIKKLEATDTQFEALKSNTSGWADVTYTVSSS